MLHVNRKPLAKKENLVQTKIGLEWNMNGLGKPFSKKSPTPEIERKNSKNQSEVAACEQKTTSEEAILCRFFSRHKTTRFFAPLPVLATSKSLLQFDFKNHENVWTNLENKTTPQYNSNSLNFKKRQMLRKVPTKQSRNATTPSMTTFWSAN